MRPEGARISGSPASGASSAGATMRAMSRLGRPPAHAVTEGFGRQHDGNVPCPLQRLSSPAPPAPQCAPAPGSAGRLHEYFECVSALRTCFADSTDCPAPAMKASDCAPAPRAAAACMRHCGFSVFALSTEGCCQLQRRHNARQLQKSAYCLECAIKRASKHNHNLSTQSQSVKMRSQSVTIWAKLW